MEKIKILYFVDRMLRGGIQSLILDWIKEFDKNTFSIDFLVLDDGYEYELEDEIRQLGCNIYKLDNIWINGIKDYYRYDKALKEFFEIHNEYKVVHLHSSSKNYLVLKYAKKYKIPIRIAHSHNIDFQTNSIIKKYVGNVFKIFLKYYATDYLACSKKAGEWLFGNKITSNDKFRIIHNAIDYERFRYNEAMRKKIRILLGIKDDEILIGHVGRFSKQKNHDFLIDIFYNISKKNSKVKLLLIGKGELEERVKSKVLKLNLNNVIFEGFKNNVNDYLQAIDIFLFPSLYEGLGLALIEAQAVGIPTFTSNIVVPEESKVSDCLKFISLNLSAEEWANIILSTKRERKDTYKDLKKAKYLLNDTVKELKKIYLQ